MNETSVTKPKENMDLWWCCPCGCGRWFKQKTKKIVKQLIQEDKKKWGKEHIDNLYL